MNNETHKSNDIPDAILELLPWYATKNISAEDKAIFENALQTYPSLQEELNLEQQVIELVSTDKSLLQKRVIASTEERLKSVFNVIDNPELVTEKASSVESDITSSLAEKIKSALGFLVPSSQYAAFAGLAVLAVTVGILGTHLKQSKTETGDYSLASADAPPKINEAPQANSSKVVLLVGFNGTAEELSGNDVLKGKQIEIEGPADNNGFFQISFKQPMNADEIKQIVDALVAQEETIWFAGEGF